MPATIAADRHPGEPPVWLVAAHADLCPVDARAEFVERVRAGAADDIALLVTCHRAEVYGVGDPARAEALAAAVGTGELHGSLRVFTGEAAVRHAFRLAAGLESAVIGEDQVLHQVRDLRESVRHDGTNPHLSRLFEAAIGVGRRSRSSRGRGSGRTLATRAIEWLFLEGGLRRGDAVIVAGAGAMGRLLAREAHRRHLLVTVASRDCEHAVEVAGPLGLPAFDLEGAAELVRDGGPAGLLVALSGPWCELDGRRLPAAVDLSSPTALPAPRPHDGRRLDIDGLYRWEGVAEAEARDGYAAAATVVVEEAIAAYERWSAGRASLDALRTLRGRAERRRRTQFERLMRRLPDLGPRERALLEAYSEQLVATVLHAPTARLREDVDGSAAEAARRLFDL